MQNKRCCLRRRYLRMKKVLKFSKYRVCLKNNISKSDSIELEKSKWIIAYMLVIWTLFNYFFIKQNSRESILSLIIAMILFFTKWINQKNKEESIFILIVIAIILNGILMTDSFNANPTENNNPDKKTNNLIIENNIFNIKEDEVKELGINND